MIEDELSLTWGEKYILSGGESVNDARIVANTGTAATFIIACKNLCSSSHFTDRR